MSTLQKFAGSLTVLGMVTLLAGARRTTTRQPERAKPEPEGDITAVAAHHDWWDPKYGANDWWA